MVNNPFLPGDFVYYYSRSGDTIPTVVLKVTQKRVLVKSGSLTSDKPVWVSPKNVIFQ